MGLKGFEKMDVIMLYMKSVCCLKCGIVFRDLRDSLVEGGIFQGGTEIGWGMGGLHVEHVGCAAEKDFCHRSAHRE